MNTFIARAEDLLRWIETALTAAQSHPRFFDDVNLSGLELGHAFLQQKLIPEVASGLRLPMAVILCGGTNTGKSTLTNSLAGRVVSLSGGGVASFTKRTVAVGDPAEIRRIVEARIGWHLRTAADLQTPDDGASALYLSPLNGGTEALPILLDTPDIDSSDTSCRRHSSHALVHADLVVWLTTQQKYKDKAGKTYLDRAMALISERIDVFNQFLPRHAEAFDDLLQYYHSQWPSITTHSVKLSEQPDLPEDGLLPTETTQPLRALLQDALKRSRPLKAANITHGLKQAGGRLAEAAKAFLERYHGCLELRKEIRDRLEQSLFMPLRGLSGVQTPLELHQALIRVIGPKVRTPLGELVGSMNSSVGKAFSWAKGMFQSLDSSEPAPPPVDPILARDRADLEAARKILEDAHHDILERSRTRAMNGHPLHVKFHGDLKKLEFPGPGALQKALEEALAEGSRTRVLPLVSRFELDLEIFCRENPAMIGTLRAAVPGVSALAAFAAAILSIHTMTILPGASEYLFGVIGLPIFTRLEKLLPEKFLSFADQISREPFIQKIREDYRKTRASIFLDEAEKWFKPVESLLSLSHLRDYDVRAALKDLELEWDALAPHLLDAEPEK